jgi:hypothetical protein
MTFSDPWIFVSVVPVNCRAGTFLDVDSGVCVDCKLEYDNGFTSKGSTGSTGSKRVETSVRVRVRMRVRARL